MVTKDHIAPFGFFVTGTDTEIGKTLVSSALVHSLGQSGYASIGMKPVAAGTYFNAERGIQCNEDVEALIAASNVTLADNLQYCVNPYLFELAAAPHIAAERERKRIELSVILDAYRLLREQVQAVIVEGVGGFRVPLNSDEDSADMATLINLPVILVVGMRLGCISHALLTVQAIQASGLTLAGWVANSPQGKMDLLEENLAALRERIPAPLLGYIPPLVAPSAEVAAGYLDLSLVTTSKS